jgi:hypothetical protein
MGKIADMVSDLEHSKGITEYILNETQTYFARGETDPNFVEWFNRRLKDYRERGME